MGYAVELYFDPHTEEHINQLRRQLKQKGGSALMSQLGERPHISLALFADAQPEKLLPLVGDFAAGLHPFALQLVGIGTFPTADNVLFLTPAPSVSLLRWHAALHAHLSAEKIFPHSHYAPGNWIPHCTIEMNLPGPLLWQAMESVRNQFTTLQGEIREIGVVRFQPVDILATWSLVST